MFYAYLLLHPISAHARNRVTRFALVLNFAFSFIYSLSSWKEACDSCDSNYFLTSSSFYNNEDAAVDFLKHHGVISSSVKCPRCGALCNFSKDRNLWRCGTKVIFRPS